MSLINISISTIAFICAFISRIRFPGNKSIPTIVRQRYGGITVKILRKLEKLDFKFRKAELDLSFLNDCVKLGVIPKFIQFRVSNYNLRRSEAYLECQLKLLKEEIKNKQSRLASLDKELRMTKDKLGQSMSLFDFTYVCGVFLIPNTKRIKQQLVIQGEKLARLRCSKDSSMVDPEQVIFNYSDYTLTDIDKLLLSKGLNYSIRPTKLNYADYGCNFELLYRNIIALKGDKDEELNFLKSRLKDIALTSFYSHNRSPRTPDNLTDKEYTALKTLMNNKDLIIQKADKGNAVVVLNRTSYVERMKELLNDESKFKRLDIKEGKEIRFIEEKEKLVKKVIKRLLRESKITKYQHDKIYPMGSQPGVLYGLSKIHKALVNGIPKLRPILSALGTSTYKLAKFLVPLMTTIVSNEYSVSNSFLFSEEIVEQNADLYMASLDVDALFTSIPVKETVSICADMLFENVASVSSLSKNDFKELLTLATNQSWFIFDGLYYDQIDGVAMGSPLGPTLANAFMCYYEKRWLSNCPSEFKPLFYRRYVDDIFVLFERPEHLKLFENYLNSCHSNIHFTSEEEVNGTLPFLDIKVFRKNGKFTTSVYRKPTFTGLYTHFKSLLPRSYKIGLVLTLLHRCFAICATYELFHKEVVFMNAVLAKNGYPLKFVQNCIRRFLNKKFTIKPVILSAEPKTFFISIPFLGSSSLHVKQKLTQSLKKTFPMFRLNVVFKTSTRLSNYFRFKDSIPIPLMSHAVYKYTCGSCNTTYYGLCERHCKVRWSEHLSISSYTGKPIVGIQTSIKDHHKSCVNVSADMSDFEIIAKEQDLFKLKIKESLFIKRDKPALNKNVYSTPLMLF